MSKLAFDLFKVDFLPIEVLLLTLLAVCVLPADILLRPLAEFPRLLLLALL